MKKELKTLKELARSKAYWNLSETELKAEAVKWLREIQGRMYDDELHYSSEFIKHFFNLTEVS